MAFDPKNLVPVSAVAALAGVVGQRTTKAVALDNIKKQIELIDPKRDGKRSFWDTTKEGKKSYTGQGSHVAFTIRVGNQALKLQGDITELAVPKADFRAALEHFAKEIDAGKMDQQLAALDGKRAARTDKMRSTRAGKKEQKAA
jgi:hypothetical protein